MRFSDLVYIRTYILRSIAIPYIPYIVYRKRVFSRKRKEEGILMLDWKEILI